MKLVTTICDLCQTKLDIPNYPGGVAEILADAISVGLSDQFDTPRIGFILVLDDDSGGGGLRGDDIAVTASLCEKCYDELREKIKELSKNRKDTWDHAVLN